MSAQLVVFTLDEHEYGLDISDVNGILRSKKFSIQKLPGTDSILEGMINLRGNISYIFNLRAKFGLNHREFSEDSKFIMLSANQTTTGFVVDEVTDIVKLENEDIQPPPGFGTGVHSKYIRGIGKVNERLIIILDSALILSNKEHDLLETIEKNCNYVNKV